MRRPNPRITPWYHGGPFRIDAVDPGRLGQGNDQHGPGFYVTTDRDEALGYARRHASGYLHELQIPEFRPLELGRPLAPAAIRATLARSPRLAEILSNFADVDSEGPDRAMAIAVGCYAALDPAAAINAMANDFFDGGKAPFCEALADATGKTGVAVATGGGLRAAIWRAAAVEVLRCTDASRT